MTRESIRPQPHQDRAQVIVLCYPPEVVLRKNGKHYEKLWRIIIDLQGGGACAEERLRSLGGETIEDRFQIIAACLDSIEEDWKNDVYAKNMRASCSELGRGVEQDIQKARLGYLDAGNLGLPVAFFNLGTLYASGRLGSRDFQKALMAFQKGEYLGCTLCLRRLQRLES